MSDPLDTLAIVGVGLLGGSVAAAARRNGLVRRVVGIGRNRERLEAARAAGLLDDIGTDVAALHDASLIVVCTPVDQIARDVAEIVPVALPSALITDVGSVKGPICREVDADPRTRGRFVGSHPIAGSEQQGWEHASPDLFRGRTCVITPTESSRAEHVEQLERFWSALGMVTVQLSPEEHDRNLALTSHLPHVAASALASLLSDSSRPFAATGFRDTTRVAAGSPDLWVPILLQNADAVTERIAELSDRLEQLRDAIRRQDAAAIHKILADGQTQRQRLH